MDMVTCESLESAEHDSDTESMMEKKQEEKKDDDNLTWNQEEKNGEPAGAACNLSGVQADGEAVAIKWTTRLCYWYGLQLSSGRRCSRVYSSVCNFCALFYYLLMLGGVVHVSNMAIRRPERWEHSLILSIFLIGCTSSYVCMRRTFPRIQRLLSGARLLMHDSDVQHMRMLDRNFFLTHVAMLSLTFLTSVIWFFFTTDSLRLQLNLIGLAYGSSDGVVIAWAIVFNVYYLEVFYSILFCSTNAYAIVMSAFGHAAHNIEREIRQTLHQAAATSSKARLSTDIRRIRIHLRHYWSWKSAADSLLNMFPFIWAAYLFLTVSMIITKMIAEWNNGHSHGGQHTYLLASMATCLFIIVNLSVKWSSFMCADRHMRSCRELAFRLTDPRLHNSSRASFGHHADDIRQSSAEAEQLSREMLGLHLDLCNAPNTDNTILSAMAFNLKSLISFAGALVNFAVMVLSIRMAVRQ